MDNPIQWDITGILCITALLAAGALLGWITGWDTT